MPGTLAAIYTQLQAHFGTNPNWWPIFGDDAPFEMMLGAVLVQQTRWEAVEGAVLRLREAGLLGPAPLAQADPVAVAGLLRPVAFYTQKASGIRAISHYLCSHYAGNAARMLVQPTAALRAELLGLPRIGPETADVILLYAGQHPVFVVDDYTRRLFGRIEPALVLPDRKGFDWQRARYDAVQQCVETELSVVAAQVGSVPVSAHAVRQAYYADYHALINEQCVRYCVARNPRCDGPPARRIYSVQEGRESYQHRHDGCPLRSICSFYQSRLAG